MADQFGSSTSMKCDRCHNTATLHITEVDDADDFEEMHLCEQCAAKYGSDPQPTKTPALKSSLSQQLAEVEEGSESSRHVCDQCGLTFTEFRNSGRLGCPHDYEAFRSELAPLLENIHGEIRHTGKTPRRYPKTKQTQSELMQLRNRLKQAVSEEDYEEAAGIRDQIKELEES